MMHRHSLLPLPGRDAQRQPIYESVTGRSAVAGAAREKSRGQAQRNAKTESGLDHPSSTLSACQTHKRQFNCLRALLSNSGSQEFPSPAPDRKATSGFARTGTSKPPA